MKEIPQQLTLSDVDEKYRAFVDKFKPKKTTDDCYTPENVYQAVKEWACKEYGVNPDNVVRPFWPGGDYERFPYTEDSVVIDNPPFSIITQICTFYCEYEIPFFLFAPYLTNFSTGRNTMTQHIITEADITYENGATVKTAFLTNMDKYMLRSVPELNRRIKEENDKNLKAMRKQLPKYVYPDEVVMSTDLGYMCKWGVQLDIPPEDCFFVRELDSQKATGKALFGGGFLLSEKAAAEKAAAEKWQLSEREWRIIRSLGRKER